MASARDCPPEILALAEDVRRFIRASVPRAAERVYKDGRSADYHAVAVLMGGERNH